MTDHFIEEELLEKVESVSRPPIVTGAPPPAQSFDPYSGGTLPGNLGLQTDVAARQLPGSLPVYRLMPVPAGSSGNAQSNAAAQSNLLKNPTFITTQSQTATNTSDIALLQAQTFQGTWVSSNTYAQGALVLYNGVVYISLMNLNQGNQPDSSPSDWQATGTENYAGAWSASTVFNVGQIVDYSGVLFISIQAANANHQPDVSPTWWSALGQESYAGTWSGSTNYTTGQTVSQSSSLYIALQNSLNQNPSSTTSYWQLLSNATSLYGTWSNSQAYPIGAEVSYNGSFWIATTANTNQIPAPGSSYWENVGTSAILLAAYSGSVTYSVGMQALGTDGNVYSWINTTPGSGSAPPSSNWQLVGPSSLTSVPDGSQRFAATASVLSYVPTSNMLTSMDAGSNATVSVASFTLQTSSKGSISYNSGSVTGLNYGTQYYLVVGPDPSLAGGTVGFSAYTTKSAALAAGSGYFFIGSIVTAVSGGPQTIGNNDGGVGSQSGSSQTLLFGTSTGTTTSPGTVSNATRAIDNYLTTFAALATNAGSGTSAAQLVVNAAAPTSAPWSSLTLNVLSAVPINNFTGADGTVIVQVTYVYQGSSGQVSGTLWSVAAGVTRALTLDTLSLPVNTNLATLAVTGKVSRSTGTHNCEIDIYQCWVTATI